MKDLYFNLKYDYDYDYDDGYEYNNEKYEWNAILM
jgi:hypothetical protein